MTTAPDTGAPRAPEASVHTSDHRHAFLATRSRRSASSTATSVPARSTPLKECFAPEYGVAPTAPNVLGVLSLIFWSLNFVVSLKYLVFIMQADNRGEGGIMALLALLHPLVRGRARGGCGGARAVRALLYGDGMITPAISVLGAVEFDPVREPRRSPLEHADALAHAYSDVDGTRTATERLVSGLRRRAGRTVSVPSGASDAVFLKAVAERDASLVSSVQIILRALRDPVPIAELNGVGDAIRAVERRTFDASSTSEMTITVREDQRCFLAFAMPSQRESSDRTPRSTMCW